MWKLIIFVSIGNSPVGSFCSAFSPSKSVSIPTRWRHSLHPFVSSSLRSLVEEIDENDENDENDVYDLNDGLSDTVRYRGRVAYDGTGYSGWQVQSKGRTVQGKIEAVLSRRFNREIRVVGAGRTDGGVHARGQAFNFDLLPHELGTSPDSLRLLEYSMNKMLTVDTRVWNISPAPDSTLLSLTGGTPRKYKWHVIYNAEKKLYSYRIGTKHALSPLQRYTRSHVYDQLDLDLLKKVLGHYEGTHDFRAFSGAIERNERKKGGKSMSTFRTVYNVDFVDEGDGDYRIDVYLKGALYKMVRNMVGTALDVAKGVMEEARMLELLKQDASVLYTRKDNPTKPAPPEGLTLEWVWFQDWD